MARQLFREGMAVLLREVVREDAFESTTPALKRGAWGIFPQARRCPAPVPDPAGRETRELRSSGQDTQERLLNSWPCRSALKARSGCRAVCWTQQAGGTLARGAVWEGRPRRVRPPRKGSRKGTERRPPSWCSC